MQLTEVMDLHPFASVSWRWGLPWDARASAYHCARYEESAVYSQKFPFWCSYQVLHFGNAFESFILLKFQELYPDTTAYSLQILVRMIRILRPFAPLKSCAAELKRHRCRGAEVWMCHQNPHPAVGYQHDWPEGPRFSGFGRHVEDVHMSRVAFTAYQHIAKEMFPPISIDHVS